MRTVVVVALLTAGLLTSPVGPAVADENPRIAVFAADGVTPLGETPVHEGDTIVVRGSGFDPGANTTGLPVPVPPGVPHGTFVTFGAFAPDWRPSRGAPSATRAAKRAAVQWVLSEAALERVPRVPFDFQRTIRRQWVELSPAGDFTAVLEIARPADVPVDGSFGVYTYAAAESVNAAEELAVPVVFDPTPGPNAPASPPTDLRWAFAPGFASAVEQTTQGSLVGSAGAGVHVDGSFGYALESVDLDPETGYGTVRYRGTVLASTRFHLGEIVIGDPWVEFGPDATWLTAAVSTSDTAGPDSVQRRRVARLAVTADPARTHWADVPAQFEPQSAPLAVALYSIGPAAPVTFGY